MPVRVPWYFRDPITNELWTLEVNPAEGGTPARNKRIDTSSTTAPDGKTIIFEGRDEARTIQLSGTILDQAQLDSFNAWYDKRYQILIQDDLGRQFYVYITSFEADRAWSVNHHWRHKYRMTMTVLDWPS
jgi:hypothetical protein